MRIDFLERRSRRAMVALALLVGLAASLGTLRWTIPAGWSEARLQKALMRTTGYRLERLGETQFSALPWPTIHVSGLALSRANEPAERVEASLVKARLNAFSWLVGEPRLVELTLFDPRIDLLPDADAGQSGDAALSAAIIDLLGRDRRHELRALRIERGTLRLGGQPWMTDMTMKLTGGVGADLRLSATGSISANRSGSRPRSRLSEPASGGRSARRFRRRPSRRASPACSTAHGRSTPRAGSTLPSSTARPSRGGSP